MATSIRGPGTPTAVPEAEAATPVPEPAVPQAPIVIIKKRKPHRIHHGGAWKVAYADFVTALMALFIVLWLLNTNEKVKKAVSLYFRDPSGHANLTGTNIAGSGESLAVRKEDMDKLKDLVEHALKDVPDFERFKDQVELIITGEGLRIELLETETGMFFESGRGEPTESGRDLLTRLAQELRKLPNKILVEGHTDARPYSNGGTYSNWELSADRANAARRVLQAGGVPASQISQIRGYADQRLRNAKMPEHPSNRRVSVIVQYLTRDNASEQ